MQTQQYFFLLLDLLIFVSPFLANLYFKIPGLKNLLINFLKTYSVVGLLLTVFASLIVSRGDLVFSTKFTTGTLIGNLPLEVVLFFFCIPFASIALYELISAKFKEKRILLDNSFFYLFAFTYLALAVVFSPHALTSNTFLLLGILMLVISYFRKNNIFLTKNFYVFSLVSFIGFIIVAAIFTMAPFVTFGATLTTGFNIGSIPFELFFVSFLVLASYSTVYYLFKKAE